MKRRRPVSRWQAALVGAGLLILSVGGSDARVIAEEPAGQVDMLFVGDIMLGRWIGEMSERHGAGYPLGPVLPLVEAADLAFGNLESPLTTAPYIANGYNLQAAPAQVAALEDAGFDVVSLANNHMTDHGEDGVLETVEVLDLMGIAHVGAGANITDAHQVWVAQTAGLDVAYLAYDNTRGSVPATPGSAGTARLDERALADVAAARDNADLVVVSLHWGDEYSPTPATWQREYARMLAESGADLIVGHHPHVVQPLEWLSVPGRSRPVLVAYSLGNFIFDQEFSEETSESVMLSCRVGSAGLESARLVPVRVDNGRVSAVGTREGERVLDRIMPGAGPAMPTKLFSAAVLPTGERDFRVGWSVAANNRRDATPLTSDADGDGQAERVQLSAGGLCVWTADDTPPWCASEQWQVWRALLDDVDGDGLAELISLAQYNEERGPAWGAVVQVWQLWDGRFDLLWRSPVSDYRSLWVADMDADGARDIGVEEGG